MSDAAGRALAARRSYHRCAGNAAAGAWASANARVRQRAGVREPGDGSLGGSARRATGLHSPGTAGGELLHRELQRALAGRVPERASLRDAGEGTVRNRSVAGGVQHGAAAQQPGTADPHRVCSMAGSRRTKDNTHDLTILSGPQLGETSPSTPREVRSPRPLAPDPMQVWLLDSP